VIALAFALLVMWTGLNQVLAGLTRFTPMMGFPLWPFLVALPVPAVAMACSRSSISRRIAAAAAAAIATGDEGTAVMSPVAILFITFFALVLIRVPIAHALVMSSALVIWLVDLNFDLIAQQMFNGLNSFTLLAVPFFLLAGQLLNAGSSPTVSSGWPMPWSAGSAAGSRTSTSSSA
jgi:hypothetical protein